MIHSHSHRNYGLNRAFVCALENIYFAPDKFDPADVWSYTNKVTTPEGEKIAGCAFCFKMVYGWNVTKVLQHQSCEHGEIASCIGISSGNIAGLEPCEAELISTKLNTPTSSNFCRNLRA